MSVEERKKLTIETLQAMSRNIAADITTDEKDEITSEFPTAKEMRKKIVKNIVNELLSNLRLHSICTLDLRIDVLLFDEVKKIVVDLGYEICVKVLPSGHLKITINC